MRGRWCRHASLWIHVSWTFLLLLRFFRLEISTLTLALLSTNIYSWLQLSGIMGPGTWCVDFEYGNDVCHILSRENSSCCWGCFGSAPNIYNIVGHLWIAPIVTILSLPAYKCVENMAYGKDPPQDIPRKPVFAIMQTYTLSINNFLVDVSNINMTMGLAKRHI